jgi:hypothetical protein
MFSTCKCSCHQGRQVLCSCFIQCCPEFGQTQQLLVKCTRCFRWLRMEDSVQHLSCEAPKPIEFLTLTLPAIRGGKDS